MRCQGTEEFPIVAAKTQVIFLFGIGGILARRKLLDEEFCILRAMRVVTGGASTVVDRTMELLHVLLYDILMAVET